MPLLASRPEAADDLLDEPNDGIETAMNRFNPIGSGKKDSDPDPG